MRIEPPPGEVAESSQAVMFADISGSTKLYARLGDASAYAIVSAMIEYLVQIGTDRRGRLIKTIGDEVMMWFPDARSAVDTAIAMHSAVEAREVGVDDQSLMLRIGLFAGPMEHRGNDVFGNTVNTAARLTSLAKARSITTDTTTLSGAGRTDVAFRRIGFHTFSGIDAPVACVEILWTTKNLTDGETSTASATNNRRLSLRLGEQEIVVPIGGAIRIGRAPECELSTTNERVSLQHATISSTVNNFVLSDSSTHGSVLIVGGKRLVLKREKTVLWGSGRIVLDADAEAEAELDPNRTIDFEVIETAE